MIALVEQGKGIGWKAASAGAGLLAAMAANTAMNAAWHGVRHEEPPLNPVAHDVKWRDALLWAALIGLAVGAAQLVARRGAAEGWRAFFGKYPKGL